MWSSRPRPMIARGVAIPRARQRARSACCAALPPRRYSTRACASSSACRSEQQRGEVTRTCDTPNQFQKVTAMKAFVVDQYNKKGILRLAEMPVPELQDNDVLVEVH